MTTTTYAKPAGTVIPLQRPQAQPRRRDTTDRSLPPASDTTWYDAELQAMFEGEHAVRHGRRCNCGCAPAPAPAEVAS